MTSIFISHSKEDKELIISLFYALKSVDIDPILEEFTSETRPPYKKIYDDVLKSQAIFLLLTPNVIGTVHTQNWIAYEVGLAHGLHKDVYVFENKYEPVKFPVPYLTHYILYDSGRSEEWDKIKKIALNLTPSPELGGAIIGALLGGSFAGKPGALFGALVGASVTPKREIIRPMLIECKYCGIVVKFYADLAEFHCPSCRRDLEIQI